MLIINQLVGFGGKPVGDPNVVTWDAGVSAGAYTISGAGLDVIRGSGDSWGPCAVVGRVATAAEKLSIDLELLTKNSNGYDSFGINLEGDGGTVSPPGYLTPVAGRHYGIQPEGNVAANDIVTIDLDGPGAELKMYINNSLYYTVSVTALSYRFIYMTFTTTGGSCRIREQIYAPKTGFTKLTA
jgi:hypothetical protein